MPKVVVTEEQWIRLGLELFSMGGEDALVIEKMAKHLKCSKSSFYWYFANRDRFIDRIISYWQDRATEQVIISVEKNETVDQKIQTLLTAMFSSRVDNDLLYYIRRIGQRESKYQTALQRIEKKRMDYFAELLHTKGYSLQIAREKSELVYYYYLGWYERTKYNDLDEAETKRQVELICTHIIS